MLSQPRAGLLISLRGWTEQQEVRYVGTAPLTLRCPHTSPLDLPRGCGANKVERGGTNEGSVGTTEESWVHRTQPQQNTGILPMALDPNSLNISSSWHLALAGRTETGSQGWSSLRQVTPQDLGSSPGMGGTRQPYIQRSTTDWPMTTGQRSEL